MIVDFVQPGKSFQHSSMHVHDVQSIASHLGEFDFSHTVNKLSFGEHYDEVVNPLDGYHKDTSSTGTNRSHFLSDIN